MSRRKAKYNLPLTIVQIVKSICADYDRRESIIATSQADEGVIEECIKLNRVVDEAFCDIEIGLKTHLMEDIKQNRGYEASMASLYIAKNTYYKRKKKIIHGVARGLYLI